MKHVYTKFNLLEISVCVRNRQVFGLCRFPTFGLYFKFGLYRILQLFSQKFVSIILTFTLTIFLKLFLSPFHKDYFTTNFNRKINPTTKIFFTRRITLNSRTASVTGELQSQVPVTWLSLHFWWKMTFNPSLKIRRFTINIYAWNQLKYTEDVYG